MHVTDEMVEKAAAQIDQYAFDYPQIEKYLKNGASPECWEERRHDARIKARRVLEAAFPALPADLAGLADRLEGFAIEADHAAYPEAASTYREAASALEALAGRQVAVTDNLRQELREARRLISSTHKNAVKHENCTRQYCPICDGGLFVCADCGAAEIETEQRICTTAPPAPQAADTRPGAANGSLRGERQATTTPPASGKVESEAVPEYVPSDRLEEFIGIAAPTTSEAHDMAVELILHRRKDVTVAAMQAEIERLTARTIELANLYAGHKAGREAAETELAKLREVLAEVRHLINTRGSHRAIPFIDAIIEGGDTWHERAESFEKAAEMSRALLKGETE